MGKKSSKTSTKRKAPTTQVRLNEKPVENEPDAEEKLPESKQDRSDETLDENVALKKQPVEKTRSKGAKEVQKSEILGPTDDVVDDKKKAVVPSGKNGVGENHGITTEIPAVSQKEEERKKTKHVRPSEILKPVADKIGFVFNELRNPESIRYIFFAIILIGISIGLAFILGQFTYETLELAYASIAGHLYGIITSSIVFFFFARFLRKKRDIAYVRTFLLLYFIIYFGIVLILGVILSIVGNIIYITSTLGNSLILFSAFTLIIFILSPEILGIGGRDSKRLFSSGQHVRVIVVYLAIALMQISGFSLLNYAIAVESGGAAFNVETSWWDLFYYSTITFATIGFGDIHPVSNAAKLSGVLQSFLSHVISLLFLAILLLYLGSSVGSKEDEKEEGRTSK